MKTLKKTDRKALVVVAAILAVLVLGSLTACAMQKAGAIEEGKPAPVEEVTGSSNDEGTADWGPGDEAEALVEDEAVEASEDASTHGESQAAAEAAGVPTPVAHGGNAANSTPAIQSAPSGEHKHSWVPVKGPREVIDVGAYTETQYRTEERLRRGHHEWRQAGTQHPPTRQSAYASWRRRRHVLLSQEGPMWHHQPSHTDAHRVRDHWLQVPLRRN